MRSSFFVRGHFTIFASGRKFKVEGGNDDLILGEKIVQNGYYFLKNGPTPASFLFIFVLFKHEFYRKKM